MARDSVLVTGSSTGIGRACALYLSRNGFRVFAGVRKQADGESLQGEASAIEPVILDVINSEQIAQVADLIKQETTADGLSGLVNNAGIPVAGPLEFIPLDELRRALEVNVVGQIAMTQAMLPMLRAARGRVVNIGSIAGRISTPFMGPYSASKFAMEEPPTRFGPSCNHGGSKSRSSNRGTSPRTSGREGSSGENRCARRCPRRPKTSMGATSIR